MIDVATRAIEHVHGHLGWLSAAALLHPAWMLRRPLRKLSLVTVASTVLVSLPLLTALLIYPAYRASLKQGVFVRTPTVGWMFERKEHLAIGAVALAWAGLALHVASLQVEGAETRGQLARGAHLAFVVAAVLTWAVAALGTWVASVAPF